MIFVPFRPASVTPMAAQRPQSGIWRQARTGQLSVQSNGLRLFCSGKAACRAAAAPTAAGRHAFAQGPHRPGLERKSAGFQRAGGAHLAFRSCGAAVRAGRSRAAVDQFFKFCPAGCADKIVHGHGAPRQSGVQPGLVGRRACGRTLLAYIRRCIDNGKGGLPPNAANSSTGPRPGPCGQPERAARGVKR